MGKAILMSSFAIMLMANFSTTTLICAIAYFIFLSVIDSGRGYKTLPSTIMARLMFGFWVFCFAWYLAGIGPVFVKFSETITVAFTMTMIVFAYWWTIRYLGQLTLKNNADYQEFVSRGGHFLWDFMPKILSSDSDNVSCGGLPEPKTSFKPPQYWRYQCPKCGARVEHQIDSCWNCNYGNSTIVFRTF